MDSDYSGRILTFVLSQLAGQRCHISREASNIFWFGTDVDSGGHGAQLINSIDFGDLLILRGNILFNGVFVQRSKITGSAK